MILIIFKSYKLYWYLVAAIVWNICNIEIKESSGFIGLGNI